MTDLAIKIENLSKIYKLYPSNTHRLKEALHPLRTKYHTDYYAFKNLNLSVKRGEVVGIVGRNGAGKSTLLKVISGASTPTEGNIWVNGNISALLELGSGLNPEFTGLENVYFYGSIMGYSRKEMDGRLAEIISFADIGDFVNRPMKIYSKGMIARLAFAIATNIDPDILVIDEVLAVGDELFQRKCYAKVEKFMKAGVSILFVSHNAEAINHLCTRAALIEKGELILDGPPKLVTAQYHRLLYANPEDTLKVRDEIGRLNQNEILKREVLDEINKMTHPGKEVNDFQRNKTIEVKKPNKTRQKAYYVPQLKPKSTVEYKSCDVEISKVHIKTLDGEIVNILVLDEEYIYSCKIKFNIDAQNVSFGMRIKSDKGLHISGAATHRINVFIDNVLKGEEYDVSCRFKCLLLPGTYFTNIGVARILNDKTVFLNRIVDATVFKVQPVQNILYSGLVNLDQKMTITKINSPIK